MNVFNISTHIHNEHIKIKYIHSYIFVNGGKIVKKLEVKQVRIG